ncbi:WD40 repeat-like protein [Lipomyces japonicus]|uniref:WD40 repeat-like protein n=1 Tax=Lipomyces japonicus TaxID=56871 RepID=UPI0034CF28EE
MLIPVASATLRAHNSPITSVAFHADNTRLVSGDEEGWVIQWSIITRRPMSIFRPHRGVILALHWLKDDLLLTHARDNKIYVFRIENQNLDTRLPTANDSGESHQKPWMVLSMDVNALNFCGAAVVETNRIAVPGTLDSDTIDVYDLFPDFSRPYKAIKHNNLKTGIVMTLQFASRTKLLSGYESGHVIIFELLNNAVTAICYANKCHTQPLLSLSINYIDNTFLSSSADSKLVKHLLSPTSAESESLSTNDIHHSGISSVDVRDDNKIITVACWDGRVRVFLYKSCNVLASFKGGRQDGVTVARFGKTVWEDEAYTTDLESKDSRVVQKSNILLRHENKIKKKHWIAVGGKDGRIGLWEIY